MSRVKKIGLSIILLGTVVLVLFSINTVLKTPPANNTLAENGTFEVEAILSEVSDCSASTNDAPTYKELRDRLRQESNNALAMNDSFTEEKGVGRPQGSGGEEVLPVATTIDWDKVELSMAQISKTSETGLLNQAGISSLEETESSKLREMAPTYIHLIQENDE